MPWLSELLPASIRYNNPGAQYPGESASAFGSTGFGVIGGGHKIARFDDPEAGAAAQFDLLNRRYSGMPLSDAITKWSGGNSSPQYIQSVSRSLGLDPTTPITPDFLKNPETAIPFAKAMAKFEAGRDFPLSDEQWQAAHSRAFGGPSAYASGSPAGPVTQAADLPSEITGGRSIPRNASPTVGQTRMEQPGFLSQLASLGGGNGSPGFGDRLSAGFQGFANSGALLPAVSNLLSGLATGQRSDPRGIEMQREQSLQRYARNAPDTDPQLRALAATHPEVAELIVKQQLAQPTLQKGDADLFGNTPFYTYKNGKLTQLTPGGGASGPAPAGGGNGMLEGMSLLAPGVKSVDSSLAGDDYLKQFSPEVQAATKAYINGDVIPTGNPRQKGIANIAKTIAQKYGQDTGIEVNDRTYAAKRQFQVDLSRTNPASAGGQRVAMQTGIEHLESLAKRIEDLGNKDVLGIAPLGRLVNSARGLQTEQAGKVNAVQQASQLFSAEIMKMYSGSQGGGVHERDDMRARFDAAKTPQELGQAIDTGLDLIAGRRHALENTRDSLGSKAEILNKADDERIARIREIASRLKAGGGPAPKAVTVPDNSGWTDVGNGVRIRQK